MYLASFLFDFKKFFSRLFFPACLIYYPLIIGVSLLWFGKSNRKKKWGKIFVTTGFALFFLMACGPLPTLLLRTLESQHNPFQLERIRVEQGSDWQPAYVLVLAGDFFPHPALPPSATVGAKTQSRMSEGVRIHRLFPESKLIFTGGRINESDRLTIAGQMADLAEIWGVERDSIITEEESRDTKDHVRFLKEMIGDDSFVIVTSASHMPRAMAMFEAAGLEPVAAPTEFRSLGKITFSWKWFLPKLGQLQKSETVIYEYMGLTWAKLRGQI